MVSPREYIELFNCALNQDESTAYYTAKMGTEVVWLNYDEVTKRKFMSIEDWNLPLIATMMQEKADTDIAFVEPKITVGTDIGKFFIRPKRYKHIPKAECDYSNGERLLDPDNTDLTDVGWVRSEKGVLLTSLDNDIANTERQFIFHRNKNLKDTEFLSHKLCILKDLQNAIYIAEGIERENEEYERRALEREQKRAKKSTLVINPQRTPQLDLFSEIG